MCSSFSSLSWRTPTPSTFLPPYSFLKVPFSVIYWKKGCRQPNRSGMTVGELYKVHKQSLNKIKQIKIDEIDQEWNQSDVVGYVVGSWGGGGEGKRRGPGISRNFGRFDFSTPDCTIVFTKKNVCCTNPTLSSTKSRRHTVQYHSLKLHSEVNLSGPVNRPQILIETKLETKIIPYRATTEYTNSLDGSTVTLTYLWP